MRTCKSYQISPPDDHIGVFATARETVTSPPPAQTLAFTVVTSDEPLTKTFTLGDDGKPRVSGGAGVSAGSARRVTLTGTAGDMAEQLSEHLTALSKHEALIPAAPPAGRDVWEMTTKSQAEGRRDVLARTKEHFAHAPGAPALLALDLDTKGYAADITARLRDAGGLTKVIAAVFRADGASGRVSLRSVSSHIRRKSKPDEKGADNGQHHYFFRGRRGGRCRLRAEASRPARARGLVLGRSIQVRTRADADLIDVTASSDPSRILYEADGVLDHADLEYSQDGRKPRVSRGGFLDTRSLLARCRRRKKTSSGRSRPPL